MSRTVTAGRNRGSRFRGVVCLLSANPLALPELERLSARAATRVRIRSRHLALTTGALEVHDVNVPNATVYVLDGYSTGVHTDAVVAALRRTHPNAKVIVMVPKIINGNHFSLLHLGIKGLVPFSAAIRLLSRAILTVAAGGVWMPRALISTFLDQVLAKNMEQRSLPPQKRLSARERQVLDCVLKSQSNKEIGSNLHIAESTVKFHLAQLFHKFGVRRRADLILQSIQQPAGLVH